MQLQATFSSCDRRLFSSVDIGIVFVGQRGKVPRLCCLWALRGQVRRGARESHVESSDHPFSFGVDYDPQRMPRAFLSQSHTLCSSVNLFLRFERRALLGV